MTETKLETNNMSAKSSDVPTNQQQQKVEKDKWLILLEGYTNEYHNCGHLVSKYSTCGATKKLLRLLNEQSKEEKWICANHAKNYELVGNWSKTWQKDFKDFEAEETEQAKKPITLQGITTSQVQQALKAKKPYPARVFLKVDNQEQDIPIFFRIKDNCLFHKSCLDNCHYKTWIKPKIKTGSYLQVQGNFDNPINSSRPSFTAYSYQLLNQKAI